MASPTPAWAILAIIAGIYDSIRWQITEHAITRITTLAAFGAFDSPSSRMVGTGVSQVLRSGANAAAPATDRISVRERRDD